MHEVRAVSRVEETFSPDYATARSRLRQEADRRKFRTETHQVPGEGPRGETLQLDAHILGDERASKAVVLSSGVHGVEAYFGSAVQLAFLESLPRGWRPPTGGAVVLLHSLNPYGFAWSRRFNEVNVDLNRNFLLTGESYSGSPPLIAPLRSAFGPGANGRFIPVELKMLVTALRHGVPAIWRSLPVGQYDYPDWLFFGGCAPSESYRIVAEQFPLWLGGAEEVAHLDFHTGLGRWGTYKLLLDSDRASEHTGWWDTHFDHVTPADGAQSFYRPRGAFGAWCQSMFPGRYRFATAEFGTYNPMSMLKALIQENRSHIEGPKSPSYWADKRRLEQVFVPRQAQWRRQAVSQGVRLVQQACDALWS